MTHTGIWHTATSHQLTQTPPTHTNTNLNIMHQFKVIHYYLVLEILVFDDLCIIFLIDNIRINLKKYSCSWRHLPITLRNWLIYCITYRNIFIIIIYTMHSVYHSQIYACITDVRYYWWMIDESIMLFQHINICMRYYTNAHLPILPQRLRITIGKFSAPIFDIKISYAIKLFMY